MSTTAAALASATRMGERAGHLAAASGVTVRCPLEPVPDLARAWEVAYARAAHTLPAAAITAAAGDTAPPSRVAIMLQLSAADADRVAVDGGEAADSLHVTLGYLAEDAAAYTDEQRADINGRLTSALDPALVPATADAFALAHFNPDDEERDPAAVVLVQSDELAAVHDQVTLALGADASTTFPVWVPHLTVAYNAGPDVIPAGVAGSTLTFDRVVVSWGGDLLQLLPAVAEPDPPKDDGQDPPADAAVTAAADQEEPDVTTPADTAPAEPNQLEPQGQPWEGPIALLGTPTSDQRAFMPGGGQVRPLPLPLSFQRHSAPGHDGKVTVGRILSVEERDGQLWGSGDFLANATQDVFDAMEIVRQGLGLTSVDVIPLTWHLGDTAGTEVDLNTYEGDGTDLVVWADTWEFGGATVVDFPAFADARIQLVDAPGAPAADPGIIFLPSFAEQRAAAAAVEDGALTASGASVVYPRGYFEPVALDGPTAFTIEEPDENGFRRVYGHAAAWGSCHTGYANVCKTPPRSASGYAYFHLGEELTDEGPLPIGHVTVGGGHASVKAGFSAAVEHYDKSCTTVAVVRAHEDEHGILLTGCIVASATAEQIDELRRSPLSGDWRRQGGGMEMIAALAVNVPGFAVLRTEGATSRAGLQTSLVAAGMVVDAPHPDSTPPTTPQPRIVLPSGVEVPWSDLAALQQATLTASASQPAGPTDDDEAELRLRLELGA